MAKASQRCFRNDMVPTVSAKAHKNAYFVLGETGFGTGKRGNWHREAQPLPSCKLPRTPPKYKCLIHSQLTFVAVLGEHKLRPPRTAMKVNSLVMRCLHFGSVRGDLLERRIGQAAAISCIQHLRPGQAAASFEIQYLRPSQAIASFGGDTEVA